MDVFIILKFYPFGSRIDILFRKNIEFPSVIDSFDYFLKVKFIGFTVYLLYKSSHPVIPDSCIFFYNYSKKKVSNLAIMCFKALFDLLF